jgi:hypothetical protein
MEVPTGDFWIIILGGNGVVRPSSNVGKKHSQHTEQGQIRTQMIDEFYAVLVCKLTKHSGAMPPMPKAKPKKNRIQYRPCQGRVPGRTRGWLRRRKQG